MTCPNCGFPEAKAGEVCPRCGKHFEAMAGVMRTSAVRVSAGGTDRVYRSVDDLPPEVRSKLQKAMHGPNSNTFVIADERGREQLYQVIAGLPPQVQKKVMARLQVSEEAPTPRLSYRARYGFALAALALLLSLLWLVWRT